MKYKGILKVKKDLLENKMFNNLIKDIGKEVTFNYIKARGKKSKMIYIKSENYKGTACLSYVSNIEKITP